MNGDGEFDNDSTDCDEHNGGIFSSLSLFFLQLFN